MLFNHVSILRYNVHYVADDALQSNVREDKIRATKKTIKKKKATPKKRGSKKQAAPDSPSSDVEATPAPKKRRGRPAGSKNKKQRAKADAAAASAASSLLEFSLDEGDPPWRTAGHEYLSRKVHWTPPSESQPCVGTVVAWIAATDVDSEGAPGFTCSRTGEPARLFHVIFDDFGQDLEEWELEECFLDEESE